MKKIRDPKREKTVILLKPDAVQRALIGEILSRFEKAGLKIIALKMVWVKKDLVAKHYPNNRDYLSAVGQKTLKSYEEYGLDPNEELGTKDSYEIGKMVRQWNMEFLTSGPIVVVLLQGVHAVDAVRMMVGNTLPRFATPGTIRGDYSLDSPILANLNKRTVKNMIHASSSIEEASFEEQLWFHQGEIYDYKRADEAVMF
ncbi:MAG: nucleoside-diphosphate kinase [Candidatus Komeilibacteria bacterium RIFCSPLOWO2_01_FULL_45_10]|uniref:nucleoside-diphosphate kinase n=1 Tax=Candidatus Komeilibacteria bacterium RIFCSPLOWO2_01_FULL_45_10 TaxID=1798550 RepID=A0A1G2BL89_9BACT|nr:MAG: nucleoside-diphosphate kinase [Candidatus Komeilibacteria bacterium RIFCSPLOWO2_01_FULL_45_10]